MKLFVPIILLYKNLRLGAQLVIALLLSLFSNLALFPAGNSTIQSQIESIATRVSDSIDDLTCDGDYAYCLVEGIDAEHKTDYSVAQYRYWYDIFSNAATESRNAFFGTVNGNKERRCRSSFAPEEEITFIYTNVNSNREFGDHWIHEYYHLELLFKGDYYVPSDCFSFVYLTETQARMLLDRQDPSLNDYRSLLGQTITIEMEEQSYSWIICNIVLENNNVSEALSSLFGNWMLAGSRFPDDYGKQYCYVFNKNVYQNYYKLNYLRGAFPEEYYSLKSGIANLKSSDQTFDFMLYSLRGVETKYGPFIGFLVASLVFQALLIGVILLSPYRKRYLFAVISVASTLVLFALGKVVAHITKALFWFNYFSILISVVFLILQITIVVSCFAIRKRGRLSK